MKKRIEVPNLIYVCIMIVVFPLCSCNTTKNIKEEKSAPSIGNEGAPLIVNEVDETSNSQNCIESHIGKYSVNIDATIENLKKMSAEKGEEVPEDQIKMMTGMLSQIELSITTDTLIISMWGSDEKMPFKARVNPDGNNCDMVLVLPAEKLPEGATEVIMTIIEIDNNSMKLKASGGIDKMDPFVWTKSEK